MPRNKYPEETIQKILDASLKAFLEKGFEQTTVLDIVGNMGGLTRGAFYHHFKSKEEVLEALFDRNYDESNIIEIVMNAKVANGLERARYAMKLSLSWNIDSEQKNTLLKMVMPLMNNPRIMAEHLKGIQFSAKLLEPVIEEGMADGSIRQGNPRVLAELFFLLTDFWMYPTVFPCTKEETMAKAVTIKQLFDGLGFPIVDDELEEMYIKMINMYGFH